ncbi:MAG: cupin domain-containing protein [Xanthobacteraceae bacterium]|jgi:quercetin dioxygenase-like cupin family protein
MNAAPMPGVSLKVLQQMDGPMPGYATVIVELEVAAGTMVGRHSHPGIETTHVVEGYAELIVDHQPSRVVHAGEAFQVPPNTVHSVKVGDKDAKACSTLVFEKGKPLVMPA